MTFPKKDSLTGGQSMEARFIKIYKLPCIEFGHLFPVALYVDRTEYNILDIIDQYQSN
jgi:hypothetical protein